MIVTEQWIESKRTSYGDDFCNILLEGSYPHKRGGIFIVRDSLKKAEQKYSVGKMAVNFISSMASWAGSGFKIVNNETFNFRLSICQSCKDWDVSGRIPKCKICGCYSGKLRIPSEKCPIGKW